MTHEESIKERAYKIISRQFVWTWFLRVLLFVVPVLPFLLVFFFLLPGFIGPVYVLLVIALFVTEFPLAVFAPSRRRTLLVIRTLQAAFCWFSIFYFLIIWASLFPGLRLFLSVWIAILLALTLWPWKKSLVFHPEWLYLRVGLLILVGILLEVHVSLLLLSGYLVGLFVLSWLVRRLKKENQLSMPGWMPLVFVAAYAMIMVVGLHIYCEDQSDAAEKIAAQEGVFRIDPDSYDPQRLRDRDKQADTADARVLFFPRHDYVAFLPYGDNLLLLPQHELNALRLNRRDGVFVLPTENVTADNLIVDADAGCYYFVMGNTLYRGFVDNDVMEELHIFNEVKLTTTIPSFLRGWPDNNVQRLLVQYGNDSGFMMYDLAQKKSYRFDLGSIVHDSIIHPDGDKIIAVANGKSIENKRCVLLDLAGTILIEEPIKDSGFVFLSPAEDEYFYLSLFIQGSIEKRSVDTLKQVDSFSLKPGIRGIKALPGGRCLLVPNYLKGNVDLVDSKTGESLAGWWLGYRVRSITTSLDGSAYYLPSAAGLFGLDTAIVSAYCDGAER